MLRIIAGDGHPTSTASALAWVRRTFLGRSLGRVRLDAHHNALRALLRADGGDGQTRPNTMDIGTRSIAPSRPFFSAPPPPAAVPAPLFSAPCQSLPNWTPLCPSLRKICGAVGPPIVTWPARPVSVPSASACAWRPYTVGGGRLGRVTTSDVVIF